MSTKGFAAKESAPPFNRWIWSGLAEARYMETFGLLLQEITDDEFASLITQIEHELGRPIPELEAIQ